MHDIYIRGQRRGAEVTLKIATRRSKTAAVRYAQQYMAEIARPVYQNISADELYVVEADTGEVVWDSSEGHDVG